MGVLWQDPKEKWKSQAKIPRKNGNPELEPRGKMGIPSQSPKENQEPFPGWFSGRFQQRSEGKTGIWGGGGEVGAYPGIGIIPEGTGVHSRCFPSRNSDFFPLTFSSRPRWVSGGPRRVRRCRSGTGTAPPRSQQSRSAPGPGSARSCIYARPIPALERWD